jgi:MFS family permease
VSDVVSLLRAERPSRSFFLALAQSALGTGAAYVALLLIAYDRLQSPWAISLVLLADLLPAMLLGPVFGAAADRWSRKWCAVGADVIRAGAFIAIALVDDFAATVGFAVLAGAGTALFTPATLAGLPSLVSKARLPAATSLYGAIADLGFTAGPGIAAAFLIVAGP